MKNYIIYTLSIMCLLTSPGCSSQDDYFDIADSTVDTQTCQLILTASKVDFDVENQSRSTSSWENGDKIYLTFEVSTGNAYGTATYDNGIWNFDYHGQLKKNILSKCSAVYFDQQLEEKSSEITLNETVAIFQDIDASYIYKDGNLYVTASLTPKTGRIRFLTENDNRYAAIHGISHYQSYNTKSGEFITTNDAIKIQFDTQSGFSPYIYGFFSNHTEPRIIIFKAAAAFTRKCSTEFFNAGQSGYMVVPSETKLQNWENGATFNIKGTEFKMIQLRYGQDAYFLGETEVTEELYNSVMGLAPTKSQLPMSGFSNGMRPSEFEEYYFFENLKKITGLPFRIPSLSEWTIAYTGYDQTLGYTYSGSNSIDDVAWYYGNSYNVVHPVKQLKPNELGFYDMSGNLSEEIHGTSGCYGGNFLSSPSECLVSSNNNLDVKGYADDIDLSLCGCRLAFSIYYSL